MTSLTPEQRHALDEAGYVILPNLLSRPALGRVVARLEELWALEGERAGRENYIERGVRRLANLANKGDVFRSIFAHPLVLDAVEAVMGPDFRLSMLNAREVPPQDDGSLQPFHCDTDNAGVPSRSGFFSCTALWMLDPMTPSNGATRVVPGTHRTHRVPADVLEDPHAVHPEETILTGQGGDVAVLNGHCWHAGGINHTDEPRRALLAHYLRADTPRPADRRQHVSVEARATMSPRELEILGLDEKQYGARAKMAVSNVLGKLKTRLAP